MADPVLARAGWGAVALLAFALGFCAPARAAGPPLVKAAWTTDVAATSGRLHAEVNPEEATSAYHFDYLTEAAYEANVKAAKDPFAGAARAPTGPDLAIGSGSAYVSAFQLLSGLAPETAYRYRVVAQSPEGAAAPNVHAFTTEGFGGGALLADGRGWEMVSPPGKNGGGVQGAGQSFGGGVLQAAGDGESVTYSSTSSFGAPAAGAPGAGQYLSARSGAGWSTRNITLPALSGAYGDEPNGVPYQLFSPDLARAVVLNGARCGQGEQCPRSYSLRDNTSGTLTVSAAEPDLSFPGAGPDLHHVVLSTCAALTPDATEVAGTGGLCEPAQANLYQWSDGTLGLVNRLGAQAKGTPGARLAAPAGAVSADGSRVYFTEGEGTLLYLREGQAGARLVAAGGEFQTASADGSPAFFTKEEHLYRYDAAGEATTDLTPEGEVLGVLGASEDGSYLYYLSAKGLFLSHNDTTTEVAAAADASDYPPSGGTARISPDGTHLAFLATAQLTGYDNLDSLGQAEPELYLYSAGPALGALQCISCNPTGERPLGPSGISGAIANGKGPGATDSYKPRNLSADGSRLFFDSTDALALQDTDKRPDAYEWEAEGAGSCAGDGGCLSLISSGRSAEGAAFVDASADGSDAFFLTDASLVPSDPGSVDLYDARVGGGFAGSPAPLSCEGDACQSLPSSPEDPNPGTLIAGSANPPPHFPKAKAPKKHHHKKRHSQKQVRGRR